MGLRIPSHAPPDMRRLVPGDPIPEFDVESIRGERFTREDLLGRPALLMFHRYARCAICNKRIRELNEILPPLQAQTGIRVLFFCHSDRLHLLDEFGGAPRPFELIPDPERRVYERFGVALSLWRTLRPRSLAAIVRARTQKPDDGKPAGLERPLTMIPADFLIDPAGRVASMHYGEHLGDTWPGSTIIRLASEHRCE